MNFADKQLLNVMHLKT